MGSRGYSFTTFTLTWGDPSKCEPDWGKKCDRSPISS